MIKLLPHWVITDLNPAFYDVESKTAIEQTGRLYAKMQELIEGYNHFVDEVNKTIVEFTESTTMDYECFKEEITKIVHDYIAMLDEKVKLQDKAIEDGLNEIKANIKNIVIEVISEMNIETGAKILETNVSDYAENMETYNNEYDIVVVQD